MLFPMEKEEGLKGNKITKSCKSFFIILSFFFYTLNKTFGIELAKELADFFCNGNNGVGLFIFQA